MARRTLVIAEAGVNHNGSLDLAKQLIDVAAEAGADVVKFQTFRANRLVTRDASKAVYQAATTDAAESQHEMLRRLELSVPMHHELIAHCDRKHISFLSTGFDIESVDFLKQLGQEIFKIPSGEITNKPYLEHIGNLRKKLIISTGMATLSDIEAALCVLETSGTPRSAITVLHCSTEYPTEMEDVNLSAMNSIRSAFGVEVGYSDHTRGIEVATAAVALGARIIEKHFTLDRSMPGPDHKASLEPAELAAMVSAIRNIERAMGDGIKRPSPGEIANMTVARKSIVARVFIRSGEPFTIDNIDVKRPGTGISPMRWDEVIGRQARRDYNPDELIDP